MGNGGGMGIQGAGGSCNNKRAIKMIQTMQHTSATTEDKHLYHTKEAIPGVNKTGGGGDLMIVHHKLGITEI